jgi:hypothetical protein
VDSIVARALPGIAGTMQVLAFETGIERTYEADLRAATRRPLQAHMANAVIPEASLPLSLWPKVGTFDVAVRTAKGKGIEALFELKWCHEVKKMSEALWDAWKLATAYKASLAPFVYLIAGAPLHFWQSDHPFVEFWTDAKWPTSSLWSTYGNAGYGFGTGKGPTELPAGMKTRRIGALPVHLDRRPDWELRCARITTTPGRSFVTTQP